MGGSFWTTIPIRPTYSFYIKVGSGIFNVGGGTTIFFINQR